MKSKKYNRFFKLCRTVFILFFLLFIFENQQVCASQNSIRSDSVVLKDTIVLLTKAEILAAGKLSVYIKNFDFDIEFKIISFELTTILRGYNYMVKNEGAVFSEAAIELINKVKQGNKLYFENIKIKGSDGTTRIIAPVTIKIR